MLLNETIITRGQITESDRSRLPKGVLCEGVWPICNIGKLNQNNRMYEEAVITDRIISFPVIAEKMKLAKILTDYEPRIRQHNLTKIVPVWEETSGKVSVSSQP